MSKLTSLFKNFNEFKSHKLYVYCDLYEKIEKFHEMDGMAETAATMYITDPSESDILAAKAKFRQSNHFDQNLLEWHKKQVEIELNKGNYGNLDSQIRNVLDL